MKKQHAALASFLCAISLFACKQKPSYKKLSSGVSYMIVNDVKGDKLPKDGNLIKLNLTTQIKDSVVFESIKANNGKPIEAMMVKPAFNGDPMEVFALLSEGDSAVIKVPVDSLLRQGMPPFTKSGDTVTFYVKMVAIQTKEEAEKEQAKANESQNQADDKLIQDYLSKNSLSAQKTESGIYYIITQPGTGANAASGQEITMNYTGTLLDGTKFDSNEDPKFNHKEPFKFKLGVGQVIKGWDQGMALLNKGAKATFIIPSSLAYGKQSMPGNPNNPKGIPANSILRFDVQMLDAK